MSEQWDDPNRQAVGLDPAWVEGTGGASPPPDPAPEGLDALTKDELIAMAQQLGVSPANAAMNKSDLIAGIEAAQAGTAGG